jgi:uncharacterized membrane protein YbhN (UPF0104 family)
VRGPLIALAKLAVSAVLIALIARTFDIRGVAGHLARLDFAHAAIVLALALATVPLQAVRWRIVLEENGNRLPFTGLLRFVLIGHFFSQTLPSSVGGDAVRAWCAYRWGLAPADALTTVLLDRLVSLLGLLALMACGLPWLPDRVPDPVARAGPLLAVVAGIGGVLALAALARAPRFGARARFLLWVSALAALAQRVVLAPRRAVPLLVVSMAGTALFPGIVFVLARAVGAELSWVDSLLLVPPVLLVSAIPVSVAGWGVREGAMVVALGFAGVAPAAGFAISVLFGLTLAVASLPGAGLWLASGESAGSLGEAASLLRGTAPERTAAMGGQRRGRAGSGS